MCETTAEKTILIALLTIALVGMFWIFFSDDEKCLRAVLRERKRNDKRRSY
jgi:hypothetical protein